MAGWFQVMSHIPRPKDSVKGVDRTLAFCERVHRDTKIATSHPFTSITQPGSAA